MSCRARCGFGLDFRKSQTVLFLHGQIPPPGRKATPWRDDIQQKLHEDGRGASHHPKGWTCWLTRVLGSSFPINIQITPVPSPTLLLLQPTIAELKR